MVFACKGAATNIVIQSLTVEVECLEEHPRSIDGADMACTGPMIHSSRSPSDSCSAR